MFYTYLWLREDGTPYYVGKGKGRRGFENNSHRQHCPSRERIVVNYWPDEGTAYSYEKYLIDFYGRIDLGTGCLRNLTDGGEGSNYWQGKQRSEDTKKKLREVRPNSQKSKCFRGHKRVPGGGKCLECQKEYNEARFPHLLGLTPIKRKEAIRKNISEGHKGQNAWNKGMKFPALMI
jgi:hypothetical protein